MTTRRRLLATLVAALAAAGCRAIGASAPPFVQTFGTMREALGEGRSQGRVPLYGLGANGAIGVGALAGLAGEVTIADGRVLVATVEDGRCVVSDADPDVEATLLVRAEVDRWTERPLPDCASYSELEQAIAAELARSGVDPAAPVPVRVRGRAARVEYHVIAGACPIATPDGPRPWRFAGPLERIELIGFYVEDAAGRWTHHDRRSHLHVLAPGRTGHLDGIALVDGVLALPR